AAENTARLRKEASQTTDALNAQKEATRQAGKEQTAANAELRKAESAHRALQNRIAKKPPAPTQSLSSPAMLSAETFLAGDVQAAKAAAQAATAGYQAQRVEQKKLEQSSKELKVALNETVSSEKKLKDVADSTT